MAERLAPEPVDLRVTSSPERRRGRSRRWGRRLVAAVMALGLLAAGTVLTAHFLAVQRSASQVRAAALVPDGMPARILVVLARPGQELPMAGTLAALADSGVSVSLLSLTDGESQPPAVASPEILADLRAGELAASAAILGVDEVLPARLRDGEVLAADPADVSDAIDQAIERTRPSAIIAVADARGDDGDSRAVAAYAVAAAADRRSGVGRVLTVTRGDREVAWNALLGAPLLDSALPVPHVAVRIDHQARAKGQVIRAHGTQSPDLVGSTYPYADRIPAPAYFRFWDREYFAVAWGLPMQ